jgi:2-polyprenyl-3-methyl-5-hydroxy-6-metoxy-1,4-benzoquinol methylase
MTSEKQYKKEMDSFENDETYVAGMTTIPELNDWRLAIGLVTPKTKVLSCGCGSGREVKYLVSIGCQVTAIDCSQKMLELSKKIEPRAAYLMQDMLAYTSMPNYDYVLCLNRTINHLPNLEQRKQFVHNAIDNLKHGGRLIISTSHRYSKPAYLLNRLKARGIDYYFSPKQIDKWFQGLYIKVHKINVDGTMIIVAVKK